MRLYQGAVCKSKETVKHQHVVSWVLSRTALGKRESPIGEQFDLAPQYTSDHFVEGLPDGGPIYCEFTVEGSKKEYRGAAKLFHLPNSSDFAIVAAE